jgi:eukaryotic-like serine/threonine-protein kinase
MGAVWVAEQTEPVRRKVALKLIKAGMDSKSVLARFEAERQALAVMDHPNIAKVLDGGLTEAGRPFFVMEYVKGVPITEYCDATRLSVPERLNLFVQVCHAVQHAHQKGIIHRDLKPSNILVAPYDDKPVPKVIDFGLAKAMHQSLTERTLHTAHETVLGTPLYMSPEQAQLNNLDVDTRSDIYSLGVLLYELLTGTTPLEKQRFKQAAWDEIRRIIREEEPPRPSTRLSSTNTLPSLAAGRQIEPARLTKLVRGELDWIVMKSLEKDRSRRYETANGFATDVQRYLAGEPVLAAPPSARYRLRKFARKHRAGLSTAAAIILLLVAGVALSTWQALRATEAEAAARLAEQDALAAQRAEAERAQGERRAKLDADAKRVEAEREKTRAEAGEKLASERLVQVDAEKQKAEKEQQIAQAVLDFLQNKLLGQADPTQQADALLRTVGLTATALKENPTIRELLDRAARELTPDRIDMNFPEQPLVQAEILGTVGVAYRGSGEFERAIGFLERSTDLWRRHLGPDDSHTLTAMNNLGYAYHKAGKVNLAIPLYEETIKRRQARFDRDHPDTLDCMNKLAMAYQIVGKAEQSLSICEESLKLAKGRLGPDHPLTLIIRNTLGNAYRAVGRVDLALPLFEKTLTLRKTKLSPDHPETLVSMNNLAGAYRSVGKLDQAVSLWEETLRRQKAVLGPDHPNTLTTMYNLALVYQQVGKLDLAVTLHEKTLERRRAKLSADHPDLFVSIVWLAGAYQATHRTDLAQPLYEEAHTLLQTFRSDDPRRIARTGVLAGNYREGRQFARAVPLFEELWRIRKAILSEGDKTRIDTQNHLGLLLLLAGRLAEAEPHLLASYDDGTSAKDFPKDWPKVYAIRLISLYTEWDKPAEAAKWQDELNRLGGANEASLVPAGNKSTASNHAAMNYLRGTGVQMLEASRFRAAELLLRSCLDHREKAGADNWGTYHTKSMLGGALLGQKKYADAEPLLLAGYGGMKLREAQIVAVDKVRLSEAAARLMQLYEALDNKVEAAKWSPDAENLSTSRYEDIVKVLKGKLGSDHPDTMALMNSLAWSCREELRFDRAIPLLEELWTIRKQNLPEGDRTRIDTQHQLGLTLVMAGRFAEAEPHLLASYRDGTSAKGFPKDWPQAYALRLVCLYAEWSKAAEEAEWLAKWQADVNRLGGRGEWQTVMGVLMLKAARFRAAEVLLRDCLVLREKTQPDHWTTFNSKSMLGAALLGQKKYADAEPLLLAGYEGMKQREAQITAVDKISLSRAAVRLVQLYEDLGNKDERARWSKELEAHKAPPKTK